MSMPASARISAEEIRNRRKLLIECQRSGDAAMVGQLERDVRELRTGLRGLMQAYAACNGTEHEAYVWAEAILEQTA